MTSRTSTAARVAVLVLLAVSACKIAPDGQVSEVKDLPQQDQAVASARSGFAGSTAVSLSDLPTNVLGLPEIWGCTENAAVSGVTAASLYAFRFASALASELPNLPAVAAAKLVFKDPPPADGLVSATWIDGSGNEVSSHVYVPRAEGLVSEGYMVPDSAQGHVVDVVRLSPDKSTLYIEHSVAPGDASGHDAPPSVAPSPAAAGFVVESYSVCHVDETQDRGLVQVSGEYEGCKCTTDGSQPFISFSRRDRCHQCCDQKWTNEYEARFGDANHDAWLSSSGSSCYDACDGTFGEGGLLQTTSYRYCAQSIGDLSKP